MSSVEIETLFPYSCTAKLLLLSFIIFYYRLFAEEITLLAPLRMHIRERGWSSAAGDSK